MYNNHLKDDILVAIAVGAAKRVDVVCGRRPVQHYRLVRGTSEVVVHLTPLGGRPAMNSSTDHTGNATMHLYTCTHTLKHVHHNNLHISLCGLTLVEGVTVNSEMSSCSCVQEMVMVKLQ